MTTWKFYNPYHDPKTGQFTTGGKGGAGAAPTSTKKLKKLKGRKAKKATKIVKEEHHTDLDNDPDGKQKSRARRRVMLMMAAAGVTAISAGVAAKLVHDGKLPQVSNFLQGVKGGGKDIGEKLTTLFGKKPATPTAPGSTAPGGKPSAAARNWRNDPYAPQPRHTGTGSVTPHVKANTDAYDIGDLKDLNPGVAPQAWAMAVSTAKMRTSNNEVTKIEDLRHNLRLPEATLSKIHKTLIENGIGFERQAGNAQSADALLAQKADKPNLIRVDDDAKRRELEADRHDFSRKDKKYSVVIYKDGKMGIFRRKADGSSELVEKPSDALVEKAKSSLAWRDKEAARVTANKVEEELRERRERATAYYGKPRKLPPSAVGVAREEIVSEKGEGHAEYLNSVDVPLPNGKRFKAMVPHGSALAVQRLGSLLGGIVDASTEKEEDGTFSTSLKFEHGELVKRGKAARAILEEAATASGFTIHKSKVQKGGKSGTIVELRMRHDSPEIKAEISSFAGVGAREGAGIVQAQQEIAKKLVKKVEENKHRLEDFDDPTERADGSKAPRVQAHLDGIPEGFQERIREQFLGKAPENANYVEGTRVDKNGKRFVDLPGVGRVPERLSGIVQDAIALGLHPIIHVNDRPIGRDTVALNSGMDRIENVVGVRKTVAGAVEKVVGKGALRKTREVTKQEAGSKAQVETLETGSISFELGKLPKSRREEAMAFIKTVAVHAGADPEDVVGPINHTVEVPVLKPHEQILKETAEWQKAQDAYDLEKARYWKKHKKTYEVAPPPKPSHYTTETRTYTGAVTVLFRPAPKMNRDEATLADEKKIQEYHTNLAAYEKREKKWIREKKTAYNNPDDPKPTLPKRLSRISQAKERQYRMLGLNDKWRALAKGLRGISFDPNTERDIDNPNTDKNSRPAEIVENDPVLPDGQSGKKGGKKKPSLIVIPDDVDENGEPIFRTSSSVEPDAIPDEPKPKRNPRFRIDTTALSRPSGITKAEFEDLLGEMFKLTKRQVGDKTPQQILDEYARDLRAKKRATKGGVKASESYGVAVQTVFPGWNLFVPRRGVA